MDLGLGQKRTTLKGFGGGGLHVRFYLFPAPAAPSVRTLLVGSGMKEAAQHGENRRPQHSPEASDTHQSKSPSAMTWHHLSSDLD